MTHAMSDGDLSGGEQADQVEVVQSEAIAHKDTKSGVRSEELLADERGRD
jgi:hypothetical protein